MTPKADKQNMAKTKYQNPLQTKTKVQKAKQQFHKLYGQNTTPFPIFQILSMYVGCLKTLYFSII